MVEEPPLAPGGGVRITQGRCRLRVPLGGKMAPQVGIFDLRKKFIVIEVSHWGLGRGEVTSRSEEARFARGIEGDPGSVSLWCAGSTATRTGLGHVEIDRVREKSVYKGPLVSDASEGWRTLFSIAG